MTHPLVLPPGRCLAEWWGQLAPLQPKSGWLTQLFLHQIEAHVRCRASTPLDRLHRLVLHAIELLHSANSSTASNFWRALDERLYLGEPALRQIVRGLVDNRLVVRGQGSGVRGQEGHEQHEFHHTVSSLGAEALARGEYPSERWERRVFTFAERLDADGTRLKLPHFLVVQGGKVEPWSIDDEHLFDPAWLTACIDMPEDWKRACAFPTDVLELVSNLHTDTWQNIIVDRPESVTLVLVETSTQVLGFGIHRETWKLLASAPVISVGDNWPDLFPVLTQTPSAEACTQAWRAFAHERGIAEADATACTVTYADSTLRVAAPGRLTDVLRRVRNDSGKGLTWTLIGQGAVRKIGRIQLEMT